MRPFELALLLTIAVLIVCGLRGNWLPDASIAVGIATLILIVAIQLIVEGPRWQLWPAYILTTWIVVGKIWPRIGALGFWHSIVAFGLLFGSASLASVMPVFSLPRPTGPFAVGTVARHLIDRTRIDISEGATGQARELMIQIWYPTQHDGVPTAYRDRAELPLKKQQFSLVRTNAFLGTPVASTLASYPVVVFSPSWIGHRRQNTVQAEDLASHGFIIVGIDHPFGTELISFPDGREVRTRLGEFLDFSSDESLLDCLRVIDAELRVRTSDVQFVFDTLEQINQTDPDGLFVNRLDMSSVGVFGHSFGGAVAAEVCRMDSRCKAGANLDGSLFGRSLTEGPGKPFLLMFAPMVSAATISTITDSPTRKSLDFDVRNVTSQRNGLVERGGYCVTVHGTAHANFCDSPLYTPIRRVSHAGSIAPHRGFQIVNSYVTAFFLSTLKGSKVPLLQQNSPTFREVELECFQECRP